LDKTKVHLAGYKFLENSTWRVLVPQEGTEDDGRERSYQVGSTAKGNGSR